MARGPLATYQWFKNDAPIADATNSTYQTPPLVAGDNGAVFHVVVANNVNNVQSADAVITLGQLISAPGFVKQEIYNGALRADLEDPNFTTPPNTVNYLGSFQTTERSEGW